MDIADLLNHLCLAKGELQAIALEEESAEMGLAVVHAEVTVELMGQPRGLRTPDGVVVIGELQTVHWEAAGLNGIAAAGIDQLVLMTVGPWCWTQLCRCRRCSEVHQGIPVRPKQSGSRRVVQREY